MLPGSYTLPIFDKYIRVVFILLVAALALAWPIRSPYTIALSNRQHGWWRAGEKLVVWPSQDLNP